MDVGESTPAGAQLVVIGSSAGGIDALLELVASLPSDFPSPIVLAQHLDPDRPSYLASLLQARTSLPVVSVLDEEALRPGTIYVVPADRDVEIVADRSSKAPFDASHKLYARIKQKAMDRGLMVYPMGGTVDGKSGDHVLLAPPFIVTEADIDTIVDRLGLAIDDALAEIGVT